jgi:hypothetical protein
MCLLIYLFFTLKRSISRIQLLVFSSKVSSYRRKEDSSLGQQQFILGFASDNVLFILAICKKTLSKKNSYCIHFTNLIWHSQSPCLTMSCLNIWIKLIEYYYNIISWCMHCNNYTCICMLWWWMLSPSQK